MFTGTRRPHFLVGLCLVVANAIPAVISAGEPPSSSQDARNLEASSKEPAEAVEHGIRSAVMMAMAEARLKAVAQLDGEVNTTRIGRKNRRKTAAQDSANDQSNAGHDQRGDAKQQTREENPKQPTFRTIKRQTDGTADSKNDAEEHDTEETESLAAANETETDSDVEVDAEVPTFDLTDPAQRSALEQLAPRLDLDCAENCRGKAFVGPLSLEAARAAGTHTSDEDSDTDRQTTPDKEPPVEVAVIQNRTLTIFRDGRKLDAVKLGSSALALPEDWRRLEAVRAVEDGTIQILCHWKSKSATPTSSSSSNQEGDKSKGSPAATIHAGIYKLVGDYIGQPFERTIARRSAASGSFERIGRYEFIRRDGKPAIRWTLTADSNSSDSSLLVWNPWEGVFRPPGPPPTAPDPTS